MLSIYVAKMQFSLNLNIFLCSKFGFSKNLAYKKFFFKSEIYFPFWMQQK